MALSSTDDTPIDSTQQLGILTRTIIPSPVIKWILPARIRHRKLNDVVYIGEDFIEVKQVRRGGHFEHVISKRDFGSRICSAKVFTIDDPSVPHEDDIFQYNIDYKDLPTPVLPSQLLVLTLAVPTVMFLYLARQDDGSVQFRQQLIPLPHAVDALQHIGEHLAIDPQSRAMAIASRAGQVFLYAAKDRNTFEEELRSGTDSWSPVTVEQMVNDNGVYARISFLSPPLNDRDHVILLLVVVDTYTRRMRLKWLDWHVSSGIQRLQQHADVPLEAAKSVPSMLIPLSNADFLLVHQNRIDLWRRLLCGSPAVTGSWDIDEDCPPSYPGNSPKYPVWSNWCRPKRSRSNEQAQHCIYLCREDGLVFYMEIDHRGGATSNLAGKLDCHVGEAFASLGNDQEPDMLAVAADSSSGRIVSIGNWPSHRTTDQTRQETMDMKLVELLPNWTSVTDMAVAKISNRESRANRSHESIFVCSGKQPYGTISELREGLEARMHTFIPLDDSSPMNNFWALLDPPTGSIVLLFTTPETTSVYHISGAPTGNEISIQPGRFETAWRTLVAGNTQSHQLVQVTEREIIAVGSFDASFEDVDRRSVEQISLAVIEPDLDLIICCESDAGQWQLAAYFCHPDAKSDGNLIHAVTRLSIDHQPSCMASALCHGKVIVITARKHSQFDIYAGTHEDLALLGSFSLQDTEQVCDEAALLSMDADQNELLAICSLRDGRLVTVSISISTPLRIGTPSFVSFGNSTVKLTRLASEPDRAYATCGTDTCALSLDGSQAHNLRIERIWAADKNRPDLAQGLIYGCARLPPADQLSREGDLHTFGGSFAMLTAEEIWLTFLEHQPTVVPRQIPVAGSPFRLIHAPAHNNLICASLVTSLNGQATKRLCTPRVEFVVPATGERYGYDLEVGEQVYSLLEWAPESDETNKSWLFVLVGSKYLKHGNETEPRGRINFLQRRRGGIESNFVLSLDFPVYTMALYDRVTFAICYGKFVALYRFSFNERRLQQVCQPMLMASPAAAVSCGASMLYVTTMCDAHLAISVQETEAGTSSDLYRLTTTSTGPRADVGVSHSILPRGSLLPVDLAVMTTSEREVIGLLLPQTAEASSAVRSQSARIAFEAKLAQSIIRVRQCNVRPAWRAAPASRVLVDNLIGCCTDGSIVGVCVLDNELWRRLFWMQRLCDWSPTLSGGATQSASYDILDEDRQGNERALPVGLAGRAEVLLATPYGGDIRGRDKHIDGNVLAKILTYGGVPALRRVIEEASELPEPVGAWVKEHLEEELSLVEECVAELAVLLKSWL